MEAPSKERSKAFVNATLGSPRNRICMLSKHSWVHHTRQRDEARGTLTPLEPEGSSVLPHAFMLVLVSSETLKAACGE
jgi:hypothetical protein